MIAPGAQGYRTSNYTRAPGHQRKPQRVQRNRANGNHGRPRGKLES